MMMSHPAPQRDSLPPPQPWKIIRKVISFQEPKRAWVWVDLGQSRMEEFTIVNGTVQVWPKAPHKWYLLPTHHSPKNWCLPEASPSLRGSRETVKLLSHHSDITATDPESPMPTQLCLATTRPWTGIYTPPRVSGFHLSLSGPVAGPNGSRPKWYVTVLLRVWSPAPHVGTCEKYKFSGPTLKLMNQIPEKGSSNLWLNQPFRWFWCS